MEMVRSTDEQLPETIEAHYLNACLNMQGEQEEQKVQGLVRELEVALTTLSGKNTVIEELNREVESLRSLVKRLEQRNSQLQYKDSSTTDPERYFQYQELCDSLVSQTILYVPLLVIQTRYCLLISTRAMKILFSLVMGIVKSATGVLARVRAQGNLS